ncbi:beta-ketoacyl-[acyl-carrier-protein] synthase family protein [Photobacterium sp. SDRW27]|uniref:beta-ketoacyl-[acyl-carrier-protein] synthase family protein n=1 Tax=Photobacterium obscurum TaxID=2829490 RepID=UPI0022436A92|nr:beta-ketoacyl-[acyl-carrier-protein] synthase family protein [Photobacterium obscurum]MCW8328969.1 beta-ketoacyl-[acyl-carrier-protein] synthase family protein [Photobacterium obscurum]
MTIKISKYTSTPVYIHGCGFHSALGITDRDIHSRLQQGKSPDMLPVSGWLNNGADTVVGKVTAELPAVPDRLKRHNTFNNRLALSALAQIEAPIERAIAKYGRDRVAVIVGTSTSGIADGETALATQIDSGALPEDYHYRVQEVGNIGEFVADYFAIEGPVYTLSTACSSSGRVFLSARRLLKAGIVDAVVVGGSDSLCRLTLNGFNGLDALSDRLCNPFSENRKGINIGEAAAFMLLSLAPEDSGAPEDIPAIALLGAGDSSDAHHISAPHPEGKGAEEAMRKALNDAGLSPECIGYINAHGTATPLNDEMEAKAIHRVFGEQTPVSSTKPLTGHTLGAASAVEAAICWHVLRYQLELPAQVNDGHIAESLAPVKLVEPGTQLSKPTILSNSFAFGGNNISLIFGYAHD